ncbi:MAG: hypothetical protein EOO99_08525 [Pedobacter sp.]|nr:MAG: hypothetical protein EOO99_08525 [Pedobacter sp.]
MKKIFLLIIVSLLKLNIAHAQSEVIKVEGQDLAHAKRAYEFFANLRNNNYTRSQPDWSNVYKIVNKDQVYYEIFMVNGFTSVPGKEGVPPTPEQIQNARAKSSLRAIVMLVPGTKNTRTVTYAELKADDNQDLSKVHYLNFKDFTGTVSYYTYTALFSNRVTFNEGKITSNVKLTDSALKAALYKDTIKIVYPSSVKAEPEEIKKIKTAYQLAIKGKNSMFTRLSPDWNNVTKVNYQGAITYELKMLGSKSPIMVISSGPANSKSDEELNEISQKSDLRLLIYFDENNDKYKGMNFLQIYSKNSYQLSSFIYPSFTKLTGDVFYLDAAGKLDKVVWYDIGKPVFTIHPKQSSE